MSQDNYSPSSINDLLKNCSDTYSVLSERIFQIIKLQQKLRSILGPPLSEHLNVANFSNHSLTLHTDSPAWAAKLRFNIRTILDIVRQHCGLKELKSVRIKIVILNKDTNLAKKTLFLSENTAKMIDNTAKSIHDHKLQKSLFKLSKHRVRS